MFMTRGSVAAPGQHEEIKDKRLVSIVTKQSVSRAYGYRFMFLDPRISFPSLDNCNTMGTATSARQDECPSINPPCEPGGDELPSFYTVPDQILFPCTKTSVRPPVRL